MDMIFRAILTLSFSVTDQSLTPPVAKKIPSIRISSAGKIAQKWHDLC